MDHCFTGALKKIVDMHHLKGNEVLETMLVIIVHSRKKDKQVCTSRICTGQYLVIRLSIMINTLFIIFLQVIN